VTLTRAILQPFSAIAEQDTYLHLIEAHKYLVYLENHYKQGEGYARRIKVDGAKKKIAA